MAEPLGWIDFFTATTGGRLFRNLLIGLATALLALLLSHILFIQYGELLIYDWRIRNKDAGPRLEPPVVLVMIDQQSFLAGKSKSEPGNDEGPRGPTLQAEAALVAEVIEILDDFGVAAIGVDLILSGLTPEKQTDPSPSADEGLETKTESPSDPSADHRLDQTIRRVANRTPIVLAGRAFSVPAFGRTTFRPPDSLVMSGAVSGLQHLNPGPFGVVRDGFIRNRLVGSQTQNAFAVQLARFAEGQEVPKSFSWLKETTWLTPFTQKVGDSEAFIAINYHGPRSEVGTAEGTYPCYRANPQHLRRLDPNRFGRKIAIIGSALPSELNRYPTPMGRMSSRIEHEMWTAEIMANLTETVLDGSYLFFLTGPGKLVWLLAVGFLSAFLCMSRRLLPVCLLTLVFSLFLSYVSDYLLENRNICLPYLPTLFIPWCTALVSVSARIALDDRQIRLLRDIFGRSVSPAIAQELVEKISETTTRRNVPQGPTVISEECVCSVLFLDVANFTTLSETMPPEKIFNFTNELLDRLTGCVFENSGSLIRFTGDGLIALFGRPVVKEDHALLGGEAALRMREELVRLNAERRQSDLPAVSIRIGINTGPMMVGLLGGRQRYDYSVLGNEVNVAARFEKLNKDFGTVILVGESTYHEFGDRFICRPLGRVSLKGKRHQVSVFELVCRAGKPIPERLEKFLRLYEMGYHAIRAGEFQRAIDSFGQALALRPEDLATRKLLARAEERTQSGTSLAPIE